jgi:hypothetical protein
VKSFLESELGYMNENIVVLTDDTPVKPTRKNIMNAIKSLVDTNKLNSGDEVWFHYSGHGVLSIDFSNDEESGYDTCIAPIDYNDRRFGGYISDDTLRSRLIHKIPSGAKLYVVLDACHSGTGCDLRYKYDDSSYVINADVKPTIYNSSEWALRQTLSEFKKYPRTNGEVYCISGCQDEQESADTYIESSQMYGGVLTSTMLSLFKTNDLKAYKWKHLLKDICCSINVNGYDQVSALTSGKPLDMESPIFTFPVQNPSKPIKPAKPAKPAKPSRKNILIQIQSNHPVRMNIVNRHQMKKMIFT